MNDGHIRIRNKTTTTMNDTRDKMRDIDQVTEQEEGLQLVNDNDDQSIDQGDRQPLQNSGISGHQSCSRLSTFWVCTLLFMSTSFLVVLLERHNRPSRVFGRAVGKSQQTITRHNTTAIEKIEFAGDDKDDGHLRVTIMGGCVGSNAVNNFLYLLLHGHGIPVHDFRNNPKERIGCNRQFECNNFEVMKISKIPPEIGHKVIDASYKSLNFSYPNDPKYEKNMNVLWELNEDLRQIDEVLMVKLSKRLSVTSKIFRDRFNASFTHVFRHNVLDTLICEVKDCFLHKTGGYSMFENGTRTDVCFARRRLDPSVKILVHLYPEVLIQKLENKEKTRHLHFNVGKNLMYPSMPQTSEDVFEYEYMSDEDSFQKSLNAWIQTLEPLVKSVHPDIVESYMRPMQNIRPPPPKHADEIVNYDEVYSILKKASKLHYLRQY